MGKTYKHIPIAIPDIFRPLVQKVSDNLASEGTLDISQVTFMHGTWVDICTELQAWSKSPTKKLIKFPLVCLLYKADEKFVDSYSPEINVDILICTDTQKTYTNDQRYELIIKPIIYPIYAELKAVIGTSKYFTGYNKHFEHTKIDLPHAGQESAEGNTAYNLPDVIDGVMMKEVRLKVAQSKCPYVQPNLCLLTPCPYGLDWYFYTIFKNTTFSGLGTSLLTASVNDWEHLDNTVPMALPLPWAPEIDWQGDGNWQAMTPGATASDPWTATFDTATGYGPGFYIGSIRNGNASIQFYYKTVTGNLVSKLTEKIVQDIEFSIACADAPAYPVTVTAATTMLKSGAETASLNGYGLQIFGITKVNESFSATDEVSKTTVTTLVHGDSNQAVVNRFPYGGQSPLEQISIIKTRCKTSF